MALVDTSVWIEFLRKTGSREIQTRLRPLILNGEAGITEWVVLELMTGLRRSEKAEQLLGSLRAVPNVPFPDDGWARAWDLASTLRKHGVTPSAANCYLATIAISAEVELVHCDSDFEDIARHSSLRTMDWTEHLA